GHAHLDNVLDGRGDRVIDVEQFHVEEDLLAVVREVAGEFQTAREGELVADLVEVHGVAQRGDQVFRFRNGWKVQPDDQSVARRNEDFSWRVLSASSDTTWKGSQGERRRRRSTASVNPELRRRDVSDDEIKMLRVVALRLGYDRRHRP